MKFYLFLLVFFVYCPCFANKADSVKNYYLFKNKAEICIVDSNYAEGLIYYKRAFAYKSPNVLDVYNALVLAYQLKDSASANSFFDQMAFHGLNKEKFEKNKLGLLVKDDPLYKWITQDYDSLFLAGENTNMIQYAKIIDSLSEADQKVRQSFKKTEEEVKVLLHTDSSNLLFLKNYIKKNGFPSYDRIGSFEKSIEGWFYSPNTVWFILWHTRHTSRLLNEAIFEAVMKGDFNPDEYALLIDLQLENSIYYNALPRRLSNEGKMIFLPVPNINSVNQKRSSIHLDSIENYKKKLFFAENNKAATLFRLVPYWIMNCNFAPIDLRTWKKMTK